MGRRVQAGTHTHTPTHTRGWTQNSPSEQRLFARCHAQLRVPCIPADVGLWKACVFKVLVRVCVCSRACVPPLHPPLPVCCSRQDSRVRQDEHRRSETSTCFPLLVAPCRLGRACPSFTFTAPASSSSSRAPTRSLPSAHRSLSFRSTHRLQPLPPSPFVTISQFRSLSPPIPIHPVGFPPR
uniref:Uncharacterized protein n=1 Tax=Anopheles atroparvus TaxID=41427 RepID=A0AAG5DKV2_ANOAO